MKPILTAAEVRLLFVYDEATGMLSWRGRRGRKVKPGDRAGYVDSEGYVRVKMHGYRWTAHRLAWMYVHDCEPSGQIDHINGDRADNRLSNLRDVPSALNTQNQRTPQRGNRSGFLGVSRKRDKWSAKLTVGDKAVYLGVFDTPEEAHAAYVSAKRTHHPGCTL